ncbi:hypothetical protein VTO73DRAFT_491 [Trametes versicolor]
MPRRSRSPSPHRPNKRARYSTEPDAPSAAEVVHDPDFWFEDGNIVIVAQDTAFRVHRGILARRSEMFSGMFAVPQPENEADIEKIDGCPMVRVQDSLHDFKHFLRALYDGMDAYMMREKEPVEFSKLAALLRLSHKYEAGDIQEAALRQLKLVFPDNFEAWKVFETRISQIWKKRPLRSLQVAIEPEELIEAVNLFRRCGYEEMLPVALHMCTMLPIRTLLRGTKRADGTLETLSIDDQERCLVALGTLDGRSAEFNHRMHDFQCSVGGRPICAGLGPCRHPLRAAWTSTVDILKRKDKCESETPRRALFVKCVDESKHKMAQACDVCKKYVASSHRQFIEELWNDLPAIMGLKVSTWPPSSVVTLS